MATQQKEPKARHDMVVDGVVCYCGLGPACPHWKFMTDEERIACSQDKRQIDEAMYKGGMR